MKTKLNIILPLIFLFFFQEQNSLAQTKEDSLNEAGIPPYASIDSTETKTDSACELINGSGIKPESLINKESLEKGYQLTRFELSPCNNKLNAYKLKERISFMKKSNDTLTLEIATIASCCYDMLGDIEVKENDTLNLRFESCGNGCACVCCFSIRYQIKSSKKLTDLSFQLNGNKIEAYPYVYPKTKSIRDVLSDGTQVLKHFEDDKLDFEKTWSSDNKTIIFKSFENGLLTSESIEISLEDSKKIRIIKKFDKTGLLTEIIFDDKENLKIERSFECGVLIEETQEKIKE
jgi:hypothetical protein